MSSFLPPGAVLVVGFARTGRAVAQRLRRLGHEVVAIDDREVEDGRHEAAELGVRLLEAPPEDEIARLAETADLVVVSPGVPPTHVALGAAAPGRIVSEIELAYRLTDAPIVAVTGTNGKTTVTSLVAAMLTESGVRALAAGNIGTPLVSVVPGPGLEPGAPTPSLVVAEVSSFQLAFVQEFRPVVGTWLNLAEDHLDWHPTMAEYRAAKARIWARQGPDDVAVANAGDEAVLAEAKAVRSRVVTFGPHGDFREEGDRLVGPAGETIVEAGALPRHLPHDRMNVLAAAATALAAGGTLAGCRAAAERFEVAPHRVELVVDERGVRWYDDSKATTPSAVCAALDGFESVVLIAGGRNKGLDLRSIREHAARRGLRMPAVVAIGEAADEVAAAFDGYTPVVRARSMAAAVDAAADAASAGDAVLLSPGCASFDWYSSYGERGDDFARHVRSRVAGSARDDWARRA